jgi:murein DD-endopeptidase MepM/ murein hydrolase activator NlpD
MKKIIALFVSFFFISAIPIEKPITIEIDTETVQRYKNKYGIWEKNQFIEKQFIEKNAVVYDKEYLFPLQNKKITCGFGKTLNRYHFGVDYEAKNGDIIVSGQYGRVMETGYNQNLGKYIMIKDERQITFVYAHLSMVYLKEEDEVDLGQAIGRVGSTGNSTGPHLHLEIKYQNVYLNHQHFFN